MVCSFSDKELAQYISYKRQCFHKDQPDYVARVGVLSLGKQVWKSLVFFRQGGLKQQWPNHQLL